MELMNPVRVREDDPPDLPDIPTTPDLPDIPTTPDLPPMPDLPTTPAPGSDE